MTVAPTGEVKINGVSLEREMLSAERALDALQPLVRSESRELLNDADLAIEKGSAGSAEGNASVITRHSPGLPLPATRLVKPGGICFAGTVLKSKASSVAVADPTSASHNPKKRLNMPPSLTKKQPGDKQLRTDIPGHPTSNANASRRPRKCHGTEEA